MSKLRILPFALLALTLLVGLAGRVIAGGGGVTILPIAIATGSNGAPPQYTVEAYDEDGISLRLPNGYSFFTATVTLPGQTTPSAFLTGGSIVHLPAVELSALWTAGVTALTLDVFFGDEEHASIVITLQDKSVADLVIYS